jgi:hypothetical protein
MSDGPRPLTRIASVEVAAVVGLRRRRVPGGDGRGVRGLDVEGRHVDTTWREHDLDLDAELLHRARAG